MLSIIQISKHTCLRINNSVITYYTFSSVSYLITVTQTISWEKKEIQEKLPRVFSSLCHVSYAWQIPLIISILKDILSNLLQLPKHSPASLCLSLFHPSLLVKEAFTGCSLKFPQLNWTGRQHTFLLGAFFSLCQKRRSLKLDECVFLPSIISISVLLGRLLCWKTPMQNPLLSWKWWDGNKWNKTWNILVWKLEQPGIELPVSGLTTPTRWATTKYWIIKQKKNRFFNM